MSTYPPALHKLAKPLVLTVSVAALASCGGGGGGGNSGGGSGGGSGSANVAPTFTGPTSFTFEENQTVEFDLTVTDPDSASVTVTDDTTGDGALFSVNENGVVRATTPTGTFNFEAPEDVNGDNIYEQDITLSDGQASTTTTIRVTITDVDEAPECQPEATLNFNENVSGVIGSLVGTSIDPEGVAADNFALDGVLYIGDSSGLAEEDAQAQFTIDASTGDVVLIEALDAEKLRTEAPFRVSYTASHGPQSANCSTLFQLVDVPGVVRSGVKISSEAFQIFNIAAVGDIDGDGITDFVVNRRTFDADINTIPPLGRLVFGATINAALAVDGAEELTLEMLTNVEAFVITGNYPDPSPEQNLVHEFTFSSLNDVDDDSLNELVVTVNSQSGSGAASFDETVPYSYVIWGDTIRTDADSMLDLASVTATEALQIFGPTENFHRSINASAADMDGNGADDLLIGAPFAEFSGSPTGLNFIVFDETLSDAKTSGRLDLELLDEPEAVIFSDSNPSEGFGDDLASAGDIDGDGLNELLAAYSAGVKIVDSTEIAATIAGTASAGNRITLATNRQTSVSDTRGDVDGDGNADVLMSYGRDTEFAAIAFGSGINAAMPGDTIFIAPNRPEHETVIFGSTGNAGSETLFSTADFLGDLDGDGLDEIAIIYAPIDPNLFPEDNLIAGIYILKGSAVTAATNNFFNLSTLTAAQGVRFIDTGTIDFSQSLTVLSDIDGDGLSDIGLAATTGQDLAYIIPSSDIVDALNSGMVEVDIQANFNDEAGG